MRLTVAEMSPYMLRWERSAGYYLLRCSLEEWIGMSDNGLIARCQTTLERFSRSDVPLNVW